jgi:hypothetical protein
MPSEYGIAVASGATVCCRREDGVQVGGQFGEFPALEIFARDIGEDPRMPTPAEYAEARPHIQLWLDEQFAYGG